MPASGILAGGQRLYAALRARDVKALRDLLSPDFRGGLIAGLPNALGRVCQELDVMMSEGWGGVGLDFELRPELDRMFDAGEILIGRGWYVGTARATGKHVRAAFAHFRKHDGRCFTAVRQVTDSASREHALR